MSQGNLEIPALIWRDPGDSYADKAHAFSMQKKTNSDLIPFSLSWQMAAVFCAEAPGG